jgi:hypothetical protein
MLFYGFAPMCAIRLNSGGNDRNQAKSPLALAAPIT